LKTYLISPIRSDKPLKKSAAKRVDGKESRRGATGYFEYEKPCSTTKIGKKEDQGAEARKRIGLVIIYTFHPMGVEG